MLYKNMDVFMKMTVDEALNTLGIERDCVTKDVIKKSYRRLASKYHPDRNPDGHDVMQRVNAAYTFLSGMPDDVQPIPRPSVINLGGVTIVKKHGRTIVFGNTFPFRKALKRCRFKWNPDEKVWWYDGFYPIEDCLNDAY